MKEWSYLELTLSAQHQDVAAGILWELGTKGIEEKNSKRGQICLRAYFSSTQDGKAVGKEFETACRRAGISPKALTWRRQREKDWLKASRTAQRPFPVGDRFYIIPTLERSGDMPEDRFPLWLQPGMAFGTGTHESTQLSLEALEQMSLKGKKLLDIGTGSGILAIAGAKLGCRKVVACDIDPEAISIARANGLINQCDSEIEWIPGNVQKIKPHSFDVIVANLTAEIILEEIERISERLRGGGSLILSGILDTQVLRIRQALKAAGLGVSRVRRKGEWVCLITLKKWPVLAARL